MKLEKYKLKLNSTKGNQVSVCIYKVSFLFAIVTNVLGRKLVFLRKHGNI